MLSVQFISKVVGKISMNEVEMQTYQVPASLQCNNNFGHPYYSLKQLATQSATFVCVCSNDMMMMIWKHTEFDHHVKLTFVSKWIVQLILKIYTVEGSFYPWILFTNIIGTVHLNMFHL